MKIPLSKTTAYDLKDFVAKFFVEKKDGRGFNALVVECETSHYKTRITGATRMYFVIEGLGEFTINDEHMSAEPNDFFIIEDGDTYEYKGKMRLFEFNVPATGIENEEKVD